MIIADVRLQFLWIAFGACALQAASLKLDYVRQIGGNGADVAVGIGTDRLGNIYVVGNTTSLDFPANIFQKSPGGSNLFRIDEAGVRYSAIRSALPATVRAIAPDPSQPGTLYVSTESGLMKTTDSAGTWTVLTEGLPPKASATAIAVDPSDSRNVYAFLPNSGIYKTTDGGLSWNRIFTIGGYFDTLVINPVRPSTIFAGDSMKVFRSDDSGGTWSIQPIVASKIVFHPRHPNVAYGAFRGSVYKTEDGGNTWKELGSPTQDIPVFSIAIDSARDGLLYVMAGNLFRSTDDGASWQRIPVAMDANLAVVCDPQFPICYATTSDGVVASRDGFVTWTRIGPPRVANVRAIALSLDPRDRRLPAQLFVGTQANNDVFVAKFDGSGNIVNATYIGGAADDVASGMAVGAEGDIFVSGMTWSGDFPTTAGAYQTSIPTSAPYSATGAFVFRLADGTRLVYSTLLPKVNVNGMAIDSSGAAYVTGTTFGGIPITPGVVQPDWRGFPGCGLGSITPCFATPDGFLIKLHPGGSSLLYSTYITEGQGRPAAIAVDADGSAYVADSRVWKVDAGATRLLYKSAPLGTVAAMASAPQGGLVVTGSARWPVVAPTPNAFQRYPGWPGYLLPGTLNNTSEVDAYLANLTADGTVTSATLLSGEGEETAAGLVLDAEGNAVVAGRTDSQGLPTVGSLQGNFGTHTGFVSKFSSDESQLLYSTFVGDRRPFEAKGVALDRTGNPVFVGNTLATSTGIPPLYSPDITSDVFVARLEAENAEVRLDAVLNTASRIATSLSPGERITLVGAGFTNDGLQVLLNDTTLPILASEPGFITAVVPGTIEAGSTSRVQVVAGGRRSNIVLMNTARAGPAIYTANGSGYGQGLILNEDGTRNSPDNPAAPNSIVTIFCNGTGVMTLDDGYAIPQTPVSVFIDGFYSPGAAAHFRAAPGLTGDVFQIRVHVPVPKLPDLPDFKMPPIVAVTLDVGGVLSQPGVSIAIRQ